MADSLQGPELVRAGFVSKVALVNVETNETSLHWAIDAHEIMTSSANAGRYRFAERQDQIVHGVRQDPERSLSAAVTVAHNIGDTDAASRMRLTASNQRVLSDWQHSFESETGITLSG